ncbi:MAG: CHASE2 domain-containing protein [Chitinispirillales bacterium]|jgi:adenylate cyclase|nr:CHASE2 domain-containing protein [Chitinispirillales bacterium]
MRAIKKITSKLAISAFIGVGVAFFLWVDVVRLFEKLENASYDLRYRLKYQNEMGAESDNVLYPDYGIHIVDIDERSMEKMGMYWNWNRGFHGTMVDSLSFRFAAAIVFDVLFFNREDHNHKARFSHIFDRAASGGPESLLLKQPRLRERILSSIDYDVQFQNSIQASGRVFMGLSLADESDYRGLVSQVVHRMDMDWHNSLKPASALLLPDSILAEISSIKTIIDGIYPENATGARDIGHVNAVAVDEVIREIPLFYRFGKFTPLYLPLSVRTAATLFGTPNEEIVLKPHEYIEIGKPFKIFKNDAGEVNFSYPDFTMKQLSLIFNKREDLLSLKENQKIEISSYIALFRDHDGEIGLETRAGRIGQTAAALLLNAIERIADMDIGGEIDLNGQFSIVRDCDSEWELSSDEESFWFSGLDIKTLRGLTADDLYLEPSVNRKLLFFDFWVKKEKGILVSPLPVLRAASLSEIIEGGMENIEAIEKGERRDFGNSVRIPLRPGNRHIVTYFGPGSKPFPYFSFCDVMDNKINYPLEGKIFLVGSTSPALFDIQPVPHQKNFPAVEIHASVMNSIFTNTFIQRLTPRQDFLLLILVGIAVSLMAFFFKPVWGSLCAASSLLLYCFTAFYIFDKSLLWIEMVRPVLAIILSFTAIMAYRYMTEEKDRKFLQSTFKQYLSPELIDIMYTQKQKPQLGGEEGTRTAFFTDIEGFSTFSEKLESPTKLVELLNEYLTAMTGILLSRYGTLDKYIGDAIIAFWGAPVHIPDHALQACHTALDMQHKLNELRGKWHSEGDKWPKIVHNMRMRIGINTGTITTGNMGSAVRMNYTMMGDSVNLAARLESAAKNYGVYTIISHYTYDMVKDTFEARMLDKITVVGKSEPVIIYELLCKKGELSREMAAMLAVYNRGIEKYYAHDFTGAQSCFAQAMDMEPAGSLSKKTPSSRFEEMCRKFIEHPPGPEWDGVHRLTSK